MGTSILLGPFLLQPLTGGGMRDRTADLLHAMQALSQLSYTPEIVVQQEQGKTIPKNRSYCKAFSKLSR